MRFWSGHDEEVGGRKRAPYGQSFVRSNHGTKDIIANPEKVLEIMKALDPRVKINSEKIRLDIVIGLTVTKHGLSSVTPKRLKQSIDATVNAYKLPQSPEPSSIYTDKLFTPGAERMVTVKR